MTRRDTTATVDAPLRQRKACICPRGGCMFTGQGSQLKFWKTLKRFQAKMCFPAFN